MFHIDQLVTIAPHILRDTTYHRELPPQLAGIPLRVTHVLPGHLQVVFADPTSSPLQAVPHTFISGWLHAFYTPYTPALYRRPICPSYQDS